jgi:hypothetical protein
MNTLHHDPIIDINKINKLCIDNPRVRESILRHETLKIKRVPAVLVKIKGDVDVYEGVEAYQWLSSFSEQLYSQIEDTRRAEQIETVAVEHEPPPPPSPPRNVKQQAKAIAQTRTDNLVFADEQPSTVSHVTQVKSSSDNTLSVVDQVKKMEQEREEEEREIQKRKPIS